MFRTVVLALAVASAAAFAPIKAPVTRTSVVTQAFETEIGAQQPLGFWDPLGLLENADQDRFDRLREVGFCEGLWVVGVT